MNTDRNVRIAAIDRSCVCLPYALVMGFDVTNDDGHCLELLLYNTRDHIWYAAQKYDNGRIEVIDKPDLIKVLGHMAFRYKQLEQQGI